MVFARCGQAFWLATPPPLWLLRLCSEAAEPTEDFREPMLLGGDESRLVAFTQAASWVADAFVNSCRDCWHKKLRLNIFNIKYANQLDLAF